MVLEIDRELMVNVVCAPALGDYCRVEKTRGAWKMVSLSLFSSEIELATVIVFTGFACLHNIRNKTLSNALVVVLRRLLQGHVVRFRRT
jgi:hypothetical protein